MGVGNGGGGSHTHSKRRRSTGGVLAPDERSVAPTHQLHPTTERERLAVSHSNCRVGRDSDDPTAALAGGGQARRERRAVFPQHPCSCGPGRRRAYQQRRWERQQRPGVQAWIKPVIDPDLVPARRERLRQYNVQPVARRGSRSQDLHPTDDGRQTRENEGHSCIYLKQ